MPSTRNILMAFAAALLSGANAHMMMGSPVPYGKSTLNNSPLAADGSDFPCKQRSGVYAAEGASNTMPIGVNQTLSFIGSATHGGGSCQISLTSDKAPTASSQWQVIYSIIGGCPAGATGNIGGDPNGSGASKFEFSIPQGIAPGEYTLAWTWFNKIGNREMYMNCAPVTVTGGSKKRDAEPVSAIGIEAPAQAPGFSVNKRATFPPMFVANVGAPGGGCGTTESTDLMFPNPGQFVQYAGATPGKNTAPPVHCNANSVVAATASAAPAAPSASAGSAIPPPTVPTPAPAPAAPSAVTISGTALPSMSAAPVASPVASSTPSTAPVAPAPAPSAAAPAAGSAGAQTGPCTTEGQFNCIGGTSFQQCASGSWSIVQPVASGTHCTAGLSANLGIYKRSVRFSSEHLKRHQKKWVA
ncbi:hypothetical protein MMC30_003997 [Trapelia coarctata]|nr:hypothetical protein [Trapelia coarctata]